MNYMQCDRNYNAKIWPAPDYIDTVNHFTVAERLDSPMTEPTRVCLRVLPLPNAAPLNGGDSRTSRVAFGPTLPGRARVASLTHRRQELHLLLVD